MNSVPDKVLTQHIAIVGKTGSGKTYAAKGFIERLLEANRRVIVLDPTGAHWGLRLLANKKPGFHIPIIGGEHGDAPLSVENAERLAKWLIEKNASAVIDLSEMFIGERHRFVEHFAATIYQLNKTPLHLVVDEADEFMMQNPLPETRRMFHNMDRIVRRGRIRGFRVMMISQRPAVIHKNVLSQANTLIAMRLMSPQDRKAIEGWVEGQADIKQGKAVLDTLAKLQTGEGWVWSPDSNVLERVNFPKIKTFDSSRTPEDGEEIPETNHTTSTDFEELHTILNQEEKLENNSEKIVNDSSVDIREIREKYYRDGFQSGMESATNCIKTIWQDKRQKVLATINEIFNEEINWNAIDYGHPVALDRYSNIENESNKHVFSNISNVNSSLPKAERLILTAVAQYPQGRSLNQIAILTGYAVNGGGFGNAISSLRSKHFITGSSERLQITSSGQKSLGCFTPLPRGRALLEYWLKKLGKAEKCALTVLAEKYPKRMSKQDVAKQAGYEAGGGSFGNAISKLRTLELIEGRGELKASDSLFL